MIIIYIALSSLLLFTIIYFAVRRAISPLLERTETESRETYDFSLTFLRDIEVLSVSELDEVIKVYQDKSIRNKNYEQFSKYAKVLLELKEMKHFDDIVYQEKLNKLKRYFEIK